MNILRCDIIVVIIFSIRSKGVICMLKNELELTDKNIKLSIEKNVLDRNS